ncbi:MAG: ABC transporter ATP-binding protein [Haloarculaceae archaeon]
MSNSHTTPRDRRTDSHTDSQTERDVVLELDGVTKRFADETVVEDLDLAVREGELLTLLGPSGCGKTTTLRLIAGLEEPDAGVIRLRGDPVAGEDTFVAPETRDVGIVFQEFALFPHKTAAENVAFGLHDLPAAEREARVDELLDLVGLTAHRDSYPDELSGGQQQRVALARSLAPEPQLLLLDEPFSNLDVDLRVEMREEVRSILKAAGVTAVSVTHDQEEAMSISDRVAVVHDGAIEQVGEPETVFQHPESRFVASFLGHASFLAGVIRGDYVDTALGKVPVDRVHGLSEVYDGVGVDLLVRPDDLAVEAVSDVEANGEVVHRRFLGPNVLYRVELDGGDVVGCMHNHEHEVPRDEPVRVELDADHELSWFPEDATAVPEETLDGDPADRADRDRTRRSDDGSIEADGAGDESVTGPVEQSRRDE